MIHTLDLFWLPSDGFIRFVLAVTSKGPIVLMCSDLSIDPVSALELYCFRMRVENMFDMLKNLIGAFRYRFWSKKMPKHSRKPKKNKDLKTVPEKAAGHVRQCWEAYERFVMIASISLGMLQLIALKYTQRIWDLYDGFLRTHSRGTPSERTVKHVISRLLIKELFLFAPSAIIGQIQKRYIGFKKGFFP